MRFVCVMAQARDEHNVGANVAFLTYSLMFIHLRASCSSHLHAQNCSQRTQLNPGIHVNRRWLGWAGLGCLQRQPGTDCAQCLRALRTAYILWVFRQRAKARPMPHRENKEGDSAFCFSACMRHTIRLHAQDSWLPPFSMGLIGRNLYLVLFGNTSSPS